MTQMTTTTVEEQVNSAPPEVNVSAVLPLDVVDALEETTSSPLLAAIDMGSNSFHLAIAKVEKGEVRRLSATSEKVQLGAGLDANQTLSAEAIARGIQCLQQFVGRLGDIPVSQMRFVATNALRQAKNSQEFIDQANLFLPKPLEIIAGREEARLIYLGVSQTMATRASDNLRRLVVDIGGGSTEFIIGDGFEPVFTESLQLGCVSYSRQFFGEGIISEELFERAYLSARKQLRVIADQYIEAGWQSVVGSSGTIKAVLHVLTEQGVAKNGKFSIENLARLKVQVLEYKRVQDLSFAGLKEDRKLLLPAGLAILMAIFDVLDIKEMEFSEGALREGVMYDLVGRLSHEDVRYRSVSALSQRYGVDEAQSARVVAQLNNLIQPNISRLKLTVDDLDMLERAGRLHEIGLAVSHKAFQHHGAYLLQYSDIAGFSQFEQSRLSLLVGMHRRKIRTEMLQRVQQVGGEHLLQMCLLLRLAVLLQQARQSQPHTTAELKVIGAGRWTLALSTTAQYLPVLNADLADEVVQFDALGVKLEYTIQA